MAEPNTFNPFTTGATAGKYFVGREMQLQRFRLALNGLKNGRPNHLYVAGVHRTGKTSYLEKLVEIAKNDSCLAVMPTLDEERPAYDHVETILRALIEGIDSKHEENGSGAGCFALKDWEAGKDSTLFHYHKSSELESDRLRKDFKTIAKLLKELGVQGAVVCIDEGQRIHPRALSALKNALQQQDSFLIVASLRLVVDTGGVELAGRALLDGKAKEAEGDFGASRFYGAAIPLGAFDTDWEAAQCIRRRLEHNSISFEPDVIEKIGRITSRIPGDIIQLSSHVYEKTTESGAFIADLRILKETFRGVYRVDVAEAETVCDSISQSARVLLRALIKLKGAGTAAEVVAAAFPDARPEQREYLETGVRGDLERISNLCSFCRVIDGRFEVASPIQSFALELTLEAC